MTATTAVRHGDVEDMRRAAENLESANPLWIVLFGIYSRQFVAFPRFVVPEGTVVTADTPVPCLRKCAGSSTWRAFCEQ